MAARKYIGKVSITVSTKKQQDGEKHSVITVERNEKGKYDAASVVALVARVKEVSVKERLPTDDRLFFNPTGVGTVPVLLANKWGQPFILMTDGTAQPSNRAEKRILD